MNKKISFHGMDHSLPLEAHASEKLKTLELLVQRETGNQTPAFIELWLKAQKLHPSHRVELHLKTPRFDLHAHDEGTDLYVVLDNAIDKMAKLLLNSKNKVKTKEKHPKSEKSEFGEDKYPLSD